MQDRQQCVGSRLLCCLGCLRRRRQPGQLERRQLGGEATRLLGGGPAERNADAKPPAVLWNTAEVRQEVDRVLLSRYSLAAVVVDEDLEVLEIRGKASAFLSLPVGKVSFNLLRLIPQTSLFLEVERLVQVAPL